MFQKQGVQSLKPEFAVIPERQLDSFVTDTFGPVDVRVGLGGIAKSREDLLRLLALSIARGDLILELFIYVCRQRIALELARKIDPGELFEFRVLSCTKKVFNLRPIGVV